MLIHGINNYQKTLQLFLIQLRQARSNLGGSRRKTSGVLQKKLSQRDSKEIADHSQRADGRRDGTGRYFVNIVVAFADAFA